jgi:hypothetical protein
MVNEASEGPLKSSLVDRWYGRKEPVVTLSPGRHTISVGNRGRSLPDGGKNTPVRIWITKFFPLLGSPSKTT